MKTVQLPDLLAIHRPGLTVVQQHWDYRRLVYCQLCGQMPKRNLAAYRVERLCQVHKYQIKVLVLFPTFLLTSLVFHSLRERRPNLAEAFAIRLVISASIDGSVYFLQLDWCGKFVERWLLWYLLEHRVVDD